MTKTFYITPYQSNNIKKIGFWALYATLEDDYAKPVNVAAELVVAYARLVDVSLSCVDISVGCGHIAEGLRDVYAAFLHIYRRLVDVYTRMENVSRKAVESYEAKINPSKFNGRWL